MPPPKKKRKNIETARNSHIVKTRKILKFEGGKKAEEKMGKGLVAKCLINTKLKKERERERGWYAGEKNMKIKRKLDAMGIVLFCYIFFFLFDGIFFTRYISFPPQGICI